MPKTSMINTITVTVIVTVYNAESVLERALTSLYRQSFPIQKILIIDNHSKDASVSVARRFARHHRRIPIQMIVREKTYGLSDSYNLGAKLATTSHIVTMHADGVLPTRHELSRLMRVFANHSEVVAAGPRLIHREKEWRAYPFWQKCLFATSVGKKLSSGNGKFDAYLRSVFRDVGGYDTKHFRNTLGAEDADMYIRLRKKGTVAQSNACVIHAHPVEKEYGLSDWIQRRKFFALSYGRHLQLHNHDATHPPYGLYIKPFLMVVTLLGVFHPIFFVPILLYPFFYMPVMFRSPFTNRDPNILILPFILVFLVFYETFFMIYSFWFLREERV